MGYRNSDTVAIFEAYGQVSIGENVSAETIIDYYFEDLYNETDDRVLTDKIRQRIETPEVKKAFGSAFAGDLVERLFMYIKNRRTKVN